MKKMLCLVLLALFMDVQVKADPEALDVLNINLNISDFDSGPLTEERNENTNPQSGPGAMEHSFGDHMKSYPEPEPEPNKDYGAMEDEHGSYCPDCPAHCEPKIKKVIDWKLDMEPMEIKVKAGTEILFNYNNKNHNVYEVTTRKDWDDCANFVETEKEQGPISKILTKGTHFYVSTVEDQCQSGMKALIIEDEEPSKTEAVIAWKTKIPVTEITVEDGTEILFAYTNAKHNVYEVTTRKDMDECANFVETATERGSIAKTPTPGTHYYVCTVDGHCESGMKVQVTVCDRGCDCEPGQPGWGPYR